MSINESVQDISDIKKTLIGTKATDIKDRASFLQLFLTLHDSLVTEDVQKSTILTTDALTIWFLRANQYSRTVEIPFKDSEVSLIRLTQVALFICDYFDSGSGALSNAMSSLLSRLCQFTNKLQDVDVQAIYSSWLERIMNMPKTLKSFYVIIEAVIKESDLVAKQLLETYPDFPTDCINALEYDALANVSSKAFAIAHSKAYGSGDTYLESWKDLVMLNLKRKEARANIASSLLPILFRGLPSHYIEFLREIRHLDHDEIFLVVARIGHVLVPDFEEIHDFDRVLFKLSSSNPSERLDALEVIIGCIKPTKLTSKNILLTILSLLCLDVFFRESDSPQLRNRYITLMRKAVLAFKNYISNGEKLLKRIPDDEITMNGIELTKGALVHIHNYAWRQMSPTSSYCLLLLASDFLQIFIDYGFDGIQRNTRKQNKQSSKIFDIYTSASAEVLLRMTANNYEDIRKRASLMLQGCPYELLVQTLSRSHEGHLTNTIQLLYSLKGRQSDCAAEVLLSMAQIYQTHEKKKHQCLLITLVEELKRHDIQSMASQSPHGLLTAFAWILSSINSPIMDSRGWYQEMCDFLRMKLAEFWSTIKRGILDSSIVQNDYLNDHWRVLKESSELTRVLMEFSLKHEEIIISKSEFDSLSANLMEQLTIVAHRGAFSAIHLNFVEVCKLYMKRGEASVLKEWLEQNLLIIRSHTQLISRRSGGLPFLITAILNGMSIDPAVTNEAIQYTFRELLSIASQEYSFDGSETMDIPQVHAYNCMKHIVTEVHSSSVDEFVSAALEISLQNLDHISWSLKNAAVMTFTSLQVRIFGSNKMGDVVPKMNAPLFFLKFPGVSLILLEKLENSLGKVNVVVPVLSILSRLTSHKPDEERVAAFIEILESKYLGHRVWKVREMTASVITSLNHTSKIPERAMSLADRIPTMSSANEVHGALLCVASMLKYFEAENDDILYAIIMKITSNFSLLTSRKPINWTLLSACIKVLELRVIEENAAVVNDFLTQKLSIPPKYPDAARRLCLKACAEMVIMTDKAKKNVSSMIENTKYALRYEDEYEVLFTYLDFWDALPNDSVFKVARITNTVQVLAQKLLKSPRWTYVTSRVLDFLVSQDLSLNVENWEFASEPEVAVPLFFLKLKDTNKFNMDLVRQYSANDQEEKTRVTSIQAATIILENNEPVFQAEASLVLFQKLFDSASDVRRAASHALSEQLNLDSYSVVTVSQRFVPFFIQNFKEFSYRVLTRELFSVAKNLQDAEKDLVSLQFEVESDNFYMDEVAYHRQIVSMLHASNEEMAPVINECVKLIQEVISRVLGQFRPIITAWTFNLHVHAAIGKVLNFRHLRDDKEIISRHLSKLTEILEVFGYPRPEY